jgi:hypothetical protein
VSNSVIDSQLQSAMSAHTEADTDTEADTKAEKEKKTIVSFDAFWSLYPRKEKKKEAQSLWISKKLNPLIDTILTDIKTRLEKHRTWKEGFIPHPTTYLRGERWNDAIEEQSHEKDRQPAPRPGKITRALNAIAEHEKRRQESDLSSGGNGNGSDVGAVAGLLANSGRDTDYGRSSDRRSNRGRGILRDGSSDGVEGSIEEPGSLANNESDPRILP